MNQLDLSILLQGYKVIALIDNDLGSKSIRKKFKEKCEELNIQCHQLKRYSIENYFSLTALKHVFGEQIPDSITAINPDIKLQDQIGIDVRRNNRKLAEAMTLDEIKNTDFDEFLNKVEAMCKS